MGKGVYPFACATWAASASQPPVRLGSHLAHRGALGLFPLRIYDFLLGTCERAQQWLTHRNSRRALPCSRWP
jgi:hypothetical protein